MSRSDDTAAPDTDASRRPAFIDAGRRGLLQGAAVAAGASVGAGTVAAAEPVSEAPVVASTASRGYRLTDHVREYYAKARF